MSSLLARISAVLLWLAVAACSSLQPAAPIGNTDFQANEKLLLAHPDWSLKGRLGIKQNKQSDSVSLNWQQNNRDFDITLRGALGIGSTHVQGSDSGLTVEKSGEPTVKLRNLEALSREYLDFEFPAAYLLYWVRGLPVPDMPATTGFDANSRLASLSQRDSTGRAWLLTFDRYSQVQGAVLPGRVKLASGEVQLTFVVDEWLLKPASP